MDMMKTLLRIALILLAAGVVSAGLYLFASRSASSMDTLPGGRERPQFSQNDSQALPAAPGADFQPGNRDGDEGFGGRDEHSANFGVGLIGIAAQLAKVAAITALVIAVQSLIRRLSRKRSPNAAGA